MQVAAVAAFLLTSAGSVQRPVLAGPPDVDSSLTWSYGNFGKVTLYHANPTVSQVVLFVSGDGGWNLGVVDMARSLTRNDALVVGIDITHYLRAVEARGEPCSYPAGDLEALSHFVQKKLDFPQYKLPVLVGYSSGATLVYAALVESPSTFQGALSLGFCPDLPLTKPFCRGNGLEWEPGPRGRGVSFKPAKVLPVPWVVLQGDVDEVCAATTTATYVREVPNSTFILLPKVGHGFSVEKNWMPQFEEGFGRITTQHAVSQPAPVEQLKDLPLVEVPAVEGAAETAFLAVHVTGDGGYDSTDRELATELARHGIPTVVLNSLHYFWHRRTPEEAARDLDRILRYYEELWGKDGAVVIGYSMGADVLPFMVNRLPAESRAHIREMVLIGPSLEVDFEFHFADWIGEYTRPTSLPILPEVEKLTGIKVLCFSGSEEQESLCTHLGAVPAQAIVLQGGHRMGMHAVGIADSVLASLR